MKHIIVTITLCLFIGIVYAQPSGFRKISSDNNTELWQKDYIGGQPDYVIIADISRGAKVEPMASPRSGNYIKNSTYPAYQRKSLNYFWNESIKEHGSNAFAVVNAGFFDARYSNTSLSHYQKIDNSIISRGHHPLEVEKWLVISDGSASIYKELYDNSSTIWAEDDEQDLNSLLNGKSSQHVIGGLEIYEKGRGYDERTFVGVGGNKTNHGGYNKVFIFTSKYAKPDEIVEVLRGFGAEQFLMLDGGGSTQMITEGKSYIYSSRTIPHALVISSGQNSSNSSITSSYCKSSGNNRYEHIETIEIQNRSTYRTILNNYSGKEVGGYKNYTSKPIDFSKGVKYRIWGKPSENSYPLYWSTWIDLDQNGTFEDNERVWSDHGKSWERGDFYIPNNARVGQTKMRVIMSYSSNFSACGNFNWGETEDYLCIIKSGSNQRKGVSDISNTTTAFNNLSVFPNPSTGVFNLQLENIESQEVKVSSISGQLVKEQSLNGNSNQLTIDLTSEKSGVYIYEVFTSGNVLRGKLIKE